MYYIYIYIVSSIPRGGLKSGRDAGRAGLGAGGWGLGPAAISSPCNLFLNFDAGVDSDDRSVDRRRLFLFRAASDACTTTTSTTTSTTN